MMAKPLFQSAVCDCPVAVVDVVLGPQIYSLLPHGERFNTNAGGDGRFSYFVCDLFSVCDFQPGYICLLLLYNCAGLYIRFP